MSFPKAKRFSYSTPPLENNRRPCAGGEVRKNEKLATRELVQTYRKGHTKSVQGVIDDFRRSPKSSEKNTKVNFNKDITAIENVALKNENVNNTSDRNRKNCLIMKKTTFSDTYYDTVSLKKEKSNYNSINNVDNTCDKWDYFVKASTKNNEEMHRASETQFFQSSMRFDEIEESNKISEMLGVTQDCLKTARNEFKTVLEERWCVFREETELKLKAFVEDISNSSRIFLEEVQNESDCVMEGIYESLNQVADMKERCKCFHQNGDFVDIFVEQLKECKMYIRFLECKYRKLLIETEKKITEQNHLISILRAELDASDLEEMLQNVLTKQKKYAYS